GIAREPLCRLLAAGAFPLGGRPGGRGRGLWAVKRLREAGARDHASGALLPPLRALLAGRATAGEPRWAGEVVSQLEVVVRELAALPAEATLPAHARALWGLFVQTGAAAAARAGPRWALADGEALLEQGRAERGLGLLEATLGELARERPVAGWPALPRTEAAKLLAGLFARVPCAGGQAWPTGVWLGGLGARAGLRAKHLFLAGLTERPPATDPSEPFLPAGLRAALCAASERPASFPPAGRVERERLERLHFYLAACSAAETLTASAPRLGESGEPLSPSPFLLELCRAKGRPPDELRSTRRPRGRRCLDRRELVAAELGSELIARAEPALTARIRELRAREGARRVAIQARRAAPTNGRLSGETLLRALGKRLEFPPERPLSASTLNRLAACGFRAFVEKILGIAPPTERGDELEAREAGTVRHRCLRASFEALRREGLLPLQGGERRERELLVMLEAARAELDLVERELPTGHPVAWRASRRGIERRLVQLHARELSDPGWTPTHFELGFTAAPSDGQGPDPSRPPMRLELSTGPAWLGGAIDRVDLAPGALRVIDYKSGGRASYAKRLQSGFGVTELQLAVYALLAREALAPGAGRVDAAYLSIEDAELTKGVAELCAEQGIDLGRFLSTDEEERGEARRAGQPNLVARIEELVGQARRGELPATPGDCGTCDCVAACRVGPAFEEIE
ncbi:MAG: PD-(D/E)XK nuclease family protein, partial [Deltaproteobacteria bacterium]